MLRSFVSAAALATSFLAVAPLAQAEGDPAKGDELFNKYSLGGSRCATCHNLQVDRPKIGPSLYGVIGRKAGESDGYKARYSQTLKDADMVWDEETITKYLTQKDYLPDNLMWRQAYSGISEEQAAHIVAYIKENGGMGE